MKPEEKIGVAKAIEKIKSEIVVSKCHDELTRVSVNLDAVNELIEAVQAPSGRVAKIAFESLQARAQNLRYERDDYRGIILSVWGDLTNDELQTRDLSLDPVREKLERILTKYPSPGVLARDLKCDCGSTCKKCSLVPSNG